MSVEARIQRLRRHIALVKADLEELMAWDEAITLAHAERTDHELQRGEKYSAEDAARAEEIMRLFPGDGA